MRDLNPLRAEVLARPLFNRPRLAYADAVEGEDPARAELIRLQIEIAGFSAPHRHELRILEERQLRELELLEAHAARWTRDLPSDVRAIFLRGFVEEIELGAGRLLAAGPQIARRHPVQKIRLTDLAPGRLGDVLASPALRGIRALDLRGLGLTDDDALQLCHCAALSDLVWLAVDDNPAIGVRGLSQLVVSAYVSEVRWLGLTGTGADATPKPEIRPGAHPTISDWLEPRLLRTLREKAGARPWMRQDAIYPYNYPPAWWHLLDIGIDLPSRRIHTLQPDQILDRLRAQEADPARLVLVRGHYRGGQRPRWRMGIFEISDQATLRIDAWVPKPKLGELRQTLESFAGGRLQEGRWDVMFATGWSYLWVAAPFRFWHRSGRSARVEDGAFVRSDATPVVGGAVEAVETRVSKSWVTREMGVRRASDGFEPLVTEEEPVAAIDPTYDRVNLDCDSDSLVALGAALAASLGVPFEDGIAEMIKTRFVPESF